MRPQLTDDGWFYIGAGKLFLEDGREVSVIALTYGRGRIVVGRAGSWTYDDGW